MSSRLRLTSPEVKRLRAQVAQLKAERDEARTRYAEEQGLVAHVLAERDEARAELARAQAVWDEQFPKARAEVERLRAALRLWHVAYRPYREDLVREALEATDRALTNQGEA